MRELIGRHLPAWAVNTLLILWYWLLIMLILVFANLSGGEFRYGEL